MKIKLFLLITVAAVSGLTAYASVMRDFTAPELNAMNRLLECSDDVATVMKKADRIASGGCVTNDVGTEWCHYNFTRRHGFTQVKRVATITVIHERRRESPSDAPGYTVKCELHDTQEG